MLLIPMGNCTLAPHMSSCGGRRDPVPCAPYPGLGGKVPQEVLWGSSPSPEPPGLATLFSDLCILLDTQQLCHGRDNMSGPGTLQLLSFVPAWYASSRVSSFPLSSGLFVLCSFCPFSTHKITPEHMVFFTTEKAAQIDGCSVNPVQA